MSRAKTIMLVILAFGLQFAGCEEDKPAPATADPEISGNLVSVGGCKSGLTREVAGGSSCVTFIYDATTQRLQLKHVNAAFNCCPEKISAEISVEKGVIRVVESETGPNCRCNCLYDLDMLVENVPPAVFTVVVDEPLRNQADPVIEFTIDLTRETQGEHCVPRNSYPWGM